jgi:hypothetical protein
VGQLNEHGFGRSHGGFGVVYSFFDHEG